MRSLNSAWFSRPAQQVHVSKENSPAKRKKQKPHTNQELRYGLFIDGPAFGTDAGLEGGVYGLEIDAGRD